MPPDNTGSPKKALRGKGEEMGDERRGDVRGGGGGVREPWKVLEQQRGWRMYTLARPKTHAKSETKRGPADFVGFQTAEVKPGAPWSLRLLDKQRRWPR